MIRRLGDKTAVFLEMIKWEHSVFALPFAYLGLFLAEKGLPSFRLFFWITVAMISFRTMSMGLNRLLDQKIDGLNSRTAGRALPSGKLSRPFVWGACFSSLILFEVSTYALRPLCFFLSPIPVALSVLYPLTKRFTWLSHFVLGIILGIAPYGAWLASRGEWSWIPALISAGVVFWVAGFDIIYALQDVDFDRSYGLHSIPSRFSPPAGLRSARLFHLISIVVWWTAGWLSGLRFIYTLGVLMVSAFLIREHWLVRSCDLKKLEEAFFLMNAVASISLFAAAAAELMLR